MVGDRDYINYSQIAQLGERQTEDLKVMCSIHILGKAFVVKWNNS